MRHSLDGHITAELWDSKSKLTFKTAQGSRLLSFDGHSTVLCLPVASVQRLNKRGHFLPKSTRTLRRYTRIFLVVVLYLLPHTCLPIDVFCHLDTIFSSYSSWFSLQSQRFAGWMKYLSYTELAVPLLNYVKVQVSFNWLVMLSHHKTVKKFAGRKQGGCWWQVCILWKKTLVLSSPEVKRVFLPCDQGDQDRATNIVHLFSN